ncbi:MAG: DegV family protein [Lachnospiraceae bacterium]|nr:DegV family protein [Lachnospiraceae bacterium]
MKIITDSCCDLTKEYIAKHDLTVLPMTISFGEEQFRDGIDIDYDGFYTRLEKELPKTSQVGPFDFKEAFKKADDDILCITVSSNLSGTYQSACIAAEDFDNVCVIDSTQVCIAEGILVEYAVMLKEQGIDFKTVCQKTRDKISDIRVIASVDTLEYLQKGGRLSKTAAAAGALLSIKPVITCEDGEIKVLGKARGYNKANNMLKEYVNGQNGIDFSLPFELAYSGNDRVLLDQYIQYSTDLYSTYDKELPVARIGSTIGTHAGPGTVALAFFKKA